MIDFKAFGTSIKGIYHVYANLPNQDAFLIRKNQKGLLLVLCDGLGSKKDSLVGAKKLCESVEKALNIIDIRNCNLELLDKVIFSIWECLLYPFETCNALSTLQFVFINETKTFIGKVGDGLLAILGEENKLFRESKQDLTHFTTPFNCNTLLTWEVLESKKIDALFLCTDGLDESLIDAKRLDFVKDIINEFKYKNRASKKCYTLLKNHKFYDDTSLIIAYRKDSLWS
ncbi:protein phosphatase 2C domain-containing protein [Helicobacter cetorum]|uniref:protein phosphatase 2C domain-containing protein n=1 Tax=Helicobacter cetorum TaxID=138563 RepID=UPI000CF0EDCF|nr:protein phosphatase 2C domain-containing protein [Helicobacter cetorum]